MLIYNYDEIYNFFHFTIFSMEGDVLHEQLIDTGLPTGNEYLRDFEASPDGGYVMAGFNYAYPQSSWIVKVDSLGNTCGIANCDNYVAPVGINAVSPNGHTLLLYPNPASNTLHINLNQALPNAQISISTLMGNVIKTIPLTSTPSFGGINSSTPSFGGGKGEALSINTSTYPTGIYLVQLFSNGQLQSTQKLSIINR